MVFKIAADAGHAGFGVTPGKRTPAGEYEWNFNDQNVDAFVQEMSNYQDASVKVVSDPTGKRDVPLNERTDIANDWGADLYISFHHNANTGAWGTWTGTETYRFNKDTANASKSLKLTQTAHKAAAQAYALRDRGVKRANFAVLRNTKMPATLIEGGYMDSTIDIKVLRDNKKTASLGTKVAQAVAAEYGLKRKSGAVTPITSVDAAAGTLYRVQTGAFANKNNAIQAASDIRKKGFDTYIVQVDDLYKVQIGAFANKTNAEAQERKVKAAGYDAFITTNGGKAVASAEPINESQQEKISENGYLGSDTVRLLQHRFGTPEDGVISGQVKSSVSAGIDQNAITYGSGRSMMVRALQKYLGITEDGNFGPGTLKALQRKLGTPADGVLSRPSLMVRELQRRLNNGTF
ncbi:N-acetylmuramoyl-L-alanine amidase [Desemzia sp. FAM 23990]|uniref:N-acetylmuramoyl-L-alanine amidase n=1 Tax=Desemzia sp. FAM 23990 TaxID=3259520 RepID=UPI0038859E93